MDKPEFDDSRAQREAFDKSLYSSIINMNGVLVGKSGSMLFTEMQVYDPRADAKHWVMSLVLTSMTGDLGLYVPMDEAHINSTIEKLERIRESLRSRNAAEREKADGAAVN